VVSLVDGTELPARLLGADELTDIAVIKVDAGRKLPAVVWGDSKSVQVGDWILCAGNPFGLGGSVTAGIVSARGREIGAGPFDDFFQLDAPINPGNSGGPLVDDQGRLIGVNQSTANPQAGAQGIGFAIPSNLVRETAADLEKNPGKTINANGTGTGIGYLGVGLGALDDNTRAQINFPTSAGNGAVVVQIPPNGPAAKSDLQPGDVIQKINDTPVTKPDDIIGVVKALKPGQTVRLDVWSGGTKKLIVLTLGEQPADVYLQQQQQQDDGSGQ
jgi:serine protease Do